MVRIMGTPRVTGAIVSLTLIVAACGGDDNGQQAEGGGQDEELEQVSLILGFEMDGKDSAWVIGKEKGFFEERGIDLEITEGTGSSDAAKFVGNKSFDFGAAVASAVAVAVGRDVPLKMIGNHQPRDQSVIFVREESGIDSLTDLVGKRVVTGVGNSSSALLPSVLDEAGVDIESVEVEEVDTDLKDRLFVQGRYDATVTTLDGIAEMREAEPGIQLRVFPFVDYGANVMAHGLITHTDTIEENPDLVERMVAAYAESFLYWADHPDEALEVTTAEFSALTPSILELEVEIALAHVASPNTEGQPFGYMDPEDWESTLEVTREIEGLESDKPLEEYFTNEFIGDWDSLENRGDLSEIVAGG